VSTTSREIEKKFSVHGLFVLPDLIDEDAGIASVEKRPSLSLRATYVDTPSLRLAREGITLRHRSGEGTPRWTLKLPAKGKRSGGLSRDEISEPGPVGQLPEELRELLLGVLRGDHVAAVAVLQTQRETLLLHDSAGNVLGEVVDDTVSLLEGRRVVSRFREIEVEQGDADDAAAACRAVGTRLLTAGAVAGEQLPKVVRALGPQAQQPSDLPAPPDVNAASPAADLVRWSLRTGLARLVAADVGVRRVEHDAVHQMRVACRRLRSDLRTFADLLADPRGETLREELAWLAGSLGEARDLEVLQARVVRTAARDPLAPLNDKGLATIDRLLTEQETVALATAKAALGTERYVALLQLLVATATNPVVTELAEQRCRDVLPGLVGAAWRHLAKRAAKLHIGDADDDWHRARILAKRARYSAEVAAEALGKPARATAVAATQVQEVLGEHQDAAIAADRMLELPALVPRDGALAITCGRLAERERESVRAARAAFPAVWRDVKGGRTTKWFDG